MGIPQKHDYWTKLSQNELELKIKLNKDRMSDIRKHISAVRKEEVKMHLKRLQRHENHVILKMKDLLKLAQVSKTKSAEIIGNVT